MSPARMPACARLALLLVLVACARDPAGPPPATEPRAKRVPAESTLHGTPRVDEFQWIRDDTRSDPEVLALLAAENRYTSEVMAHTDSLQQTLFSEITARLKDNDASVPVKNGDYFYHREYRPGGEHPIYLRRRNVPDANAEVLLDVNTLASGEAYYNVGNWSVNESQNLLAFAEDKLGRRTYTIRFRDLTTGTMLADTISDVESDIAWGGDNRTVYYVGKDPQTLLPYRVYRHVLGTPVAEDVLVYEESDPGFYTSVFTSRSKQFVVISVQSTDASEIRLIDTSDPDQQVRLLLPREPGHDYRIRHVAGTFYIITNWRAKNFRLMQVADRAGTDKADWKEVVPHRDDVLLQDVEVFTNYIVVSESQSGLTRLQVIDRTNGKTKEVSFADAAYTARLHSNPEVDSDTLRYVYSSLTTPEAVYEYNMRDNSTVLLKQDEVLGDFDPAHYTTERIFFAAEDGVQVPVSLVYRTQLFEPGKNPLYVYGYGAYGYPTEASFRPVRLSLLDRGFVYALIHVRGGDEMGRSWYEAGKLLNKRNTFRDFIQGTRALVAKGYGASDKVFASGASAGGLVMGVIANEAPALYKGIIAHVPFVDVITTMLDASIPLTVGEFTEWGDPREKIYYDYMLAYSPYDQVRAQDYPHMLVTTALWDSQVQYFEPVKWVSKLRKYRTDNNRLLLHVDMSSGHSGPSGRYEQYRIDALEYAFILDVLGQK